MKSTAIIYHYFAHYRLPILEQLSKSMYVNFTFASGDTTEKNIELIDFSKSDNLNWKKLDNIWLVKKKLLWQNGLLKLIWNSNFDSIIFLGSPYYISTWLAVLLCKIKNIKVYYWMHGFYKDKFSWFDYIKVFIFYKMADGFFLYGNRAAQILEKFNLNNDTHVIYNSLDYESSKMLRQRVEFSKIIDFRFKNFYNEDTPVLCFIGRVNETKKLDLLIRAQKLLFEKHGKSFFNLLIIGDGEKLRELKDMTHDFSLSNHIRFLGAIYDEIEISQMLILSDLCIVPGEIGLTGIHALSYGTPVISHNNFNIQMPEVEAIEDRITGLLYEYGSLDSLVEKIEDWLTTNPIKTQEIANNCYRIIDDYYNPLFQSAIIESVLIK